MAFTIVEEKLNVALSMHFLIFVSLAQYFSKAIGYSVTARLGFKAQIVTAGARIFVTFSSEVVIIIFWAWYSFKLGKVK